MAERAEKAPGGKLARLCIDEDGSVTLSGDFFIHPEEGVHYIERALSQLDGDASLESIEASILKAISERGIELIGLDAGVIARLYKGASRVESPGA